MLNEILESRQVEAQHRFRLYDVEYAPPFGALTYKQTVLADNPSLFWAMSEDATGPSRSISKGFQSTAVLQHYNTPTFVSSEVDVCDTAVLYTAASNEYSESSAVVDTSVSVGTAYDMTVECWVKASSYTGTQVLVAKDVDASGDREFRLALIGNQLDFSIIDFGVASQNITSTATLIANQWNHVAATVSINGRVTLYVNGEKDATTTSPTFVVKRNSQTLTVGVGKNNTTYQNYFNGFIDEVAIYTQELPRHRIQQHYQAGKSYLYIEPFQQLDTAPVSYTVDSQSMFDYILSLEPQDYFKLDDTSGTPQAFNWGTNPDLPMPYYIGSFTSEPSPIADDLATAIARRIRSNQGFSTRGYPAEGNIFGNVSTNTGITISFWYKNGFYSTDYDVFLAFYQGSTRFLSFAQEDDRFKVFYDGTNTFFSTSKQYDNNKWYHVALTISEFGVVNLYINGKVVHTRQNSTRRGFTHAGEVHMACGASSNPNGVTGGAALDNMFIDEIATWNTALESSKISNIYLKGKHGRTGATLNTGGVAPVTSSFYSQSCASLSNLTNEQDVSRYVADFQVTYNSDELVSSGVLVLASEWGQELTTIFKPNSYLIIDAKYSNKSTETDWVPIGHFFVDGPVVDAITTNAGQLKQSTVSLRGVTKLLALDSINIDLEPDKLFVRKTPLENTLSTTEALTFRCPRKDAPGEYYNNFADFPTIKLWATNFTNFDSNDPDDVGAANETIRIRTASGSIQTLYGQGEIIINRNFYEDRVPKFGLGDPGVDGIQAEFYRFATVEDIDTTTVSAIGYDEGFGHYIQVTSTASAVKDCDGKTIFVKSGNATGKMFKARQYVKEQSSYKFLTSATTAARAGSYANWTGSASAILSTETNPSAPLFVIPPTAPAGSSGVSNYLEARGLAESIPSTATIEGIEVTIRQGYQQASLGASFGLQLYDETVQLLKAGTPTGSNYAKTTINLAGSSFYNLAEYTYGGPNDLWGTTWTPADLNNPNFGVRYAMRYVKNSLGQQGNGLVDWIKVRVYYNISDRIYVRDFFERLSSPAYEGLQVGDTVQIGDANLIEDYIRKILLMNGYQERDATKPFYFTIEPCSKTTQIPPRRNRIIDNRQWIEELTEVITEFAPPNYRLITNQDGSIKVINIWQNGASDYDVDSVFDHSQDTSDFNVYTRTVVVSEGGDAVNVALHSDYGGQSAVRAYKLNEYKIDTGSFPAGTVTQTRANQIVAQCFDTSPRTPYFSSTPSDPVDETSYGILFAKKGESVKTYEYADLDVMVIDIGFNDAGSEYEIGSIVFNCYNPYSTGNVIRQAMQVYAMSEEDYVAEYGPIAPDTPDQSLANGTTSYMPDAESRAWKLVLDEVSLEEDGENVFTFDDFVLDRPVKARFFKFRVAQCFYRFDVPGYSDNREARVLLPDIELRTNTQIVASASLGLDAPLNTGEYKELADRLRRRTYLIQTTPLIDTYEEAKEFAVRELIERFVEFAPIACTTIHPYVHVGDEVGIRLAPGFAYTTAIVRSYSLSKNLLKQTSLVNYRVFES